MARSLLLACALAALLAPGTLAAQDAPDAAESYASRLRRGLDSAASGDREHAMTVFREAIAASPSRPDALCGLGHTYRAEGDFTAALTNFRLCLQVAQTAGDTGVDERALFAVAVTLERLGEESLEAARDAWLAYARFADGAAAISLPTLARERITAIDRVLEQERVFVEVRARIAERERTGGAAAAP